MPKLSKYEQHALKEIHSWKAPDIGWFGQALKVINQPLDKAGDLLFKTPVVGSTIQSAIEGPNECMPRRGSMECKARSYF